VNIVLKEIDWVFTVKKRLSWVSEMLQAKGTDKQYFQDSLGINFEYRNVRMVLFYEYLDNKELQTLDDMVIAELGNDSNSLHKIAQRSYQNCERFARLGDALAKENWTKKTNEQLLQSLDHFHQQALLMIPVVYFEPNVSDSIRSGLQALLKKRNEEEKLDDYFLLLTSTTNELTIIKEQRDLLGIGAMIQEQPVLVQKMLDGTPEEAIRELPVNIRTKLNQHIKDYAWINTDDIFGYPWTEVDLLMRLKHLLYKDCKSRLQIAQARQIQRENLRANLISNLPIDGELLTLVGIAHENSHLRTHRTEVYVRTLYQASNLLDEIAKRIGLSHQDALYLSIDELREGFVSKLAVSQNELEQRKTGMAYLMVDRELLVFFGEDAHKLANDLKIFEEPPQVTELEGSVANMGLVRGIVKVVHDISELGKVEDGDILVASMTTPEFVPAMERAAAFVTDEGGITCHAAIVSREMDVPCIIGLEIVTKVLKDGDFVEVDANNGIIRKL
jgi:phosphohistidine swiveling domain-containing protein